MSTPQRISLSAKSARAAVDALEAVPDFELSMAMSAALRELRRALAPRPEKPQRKQRLAAKQSKREAKNAETAEIRAGALLRSRGFCENPGCQVWFSESNPAEMDHFFGRGKAPQSLSNCWMLCRACHRSKTRNEGSPQYWLTYFIRHAEAHGYPTVAAEARKRLDALALRDAAEQAGKAVRHG